VARLVPARKIRSRRKLGFLAGRLKVPADFDAPLPDEVIASFEGAGDAPAR
jgi:antitoxin (DNA-binding transcriptional repressor) of toxin-antitoxin stability system